jgi:hypothetical protein
LLGRTQHSAATLSICNRIRSRGNVGWRILRRKNDLLPVLSRIESLKKEHPYNGVAFPSLKLGSKEFGDPVKQARHVPFVPIGEMRWLQRIEDTNLI